MAFMAVMVYQWGHEDGREGKSSGIVSEAIAAESPPKASPVKARDRDFYAPNSEDLGPNEMRVIACGTGMPTTRAAQASSSACSTTPGAAIRRMPMAGGVRTG